MRLIIEARIDDGECDAKRDGNTIVAIVDRRDKDLSQLGLTLAEGRSLLAEVQSALVSRGVGAQIDAEIERDIAQQPQAIAGEALRQADNVSCVSVDSAWLRCCEKSETQARHVNIVAGRATFDNRAPRVYAYVHKEVGSAAARLDQFLRCNGVTPQERVSVISDDAGEFRKAVEGSQLARGRILDWFHIAMKFKAAENALFGCKQIEPLEREALKAEIRSAKWLVWHGKGGKAIARIKALDALLLPRQHYEFSTLWWNLHGITCYLRNNTPDLVNYGARHRKGLPISSSIAESAVNQVVSLRMAKKRQMRWTDAGAHRLVQIRVAVLNGKLSPSRLVRLGRTSNARSPRKMPSGATQALAA